MKALIALMITFLSALGIASNAHAYAGTLHKGDYPGCICVKAIGSKDGPKNCTAGPRAKSMVKGSFGENSGLALSRITLWFYENNDCKNRGAEIKKWSDQLEGVDKGQNHSYDVELPSAYGSLPLAQKGNFKIVRRDK